ncbi:hypothetical protein [Segatella copri]|uniref:Uncharacterized protein n=1 Tax=Segatella copri TaxID=165179 RepID=A0AAW5UK63_9BACT|nr:hypothetical protein [Segatella copri]MCW4138958.1 hypothetical protein [Segatella copri]MCW4144899.1 hypothetical protein [Segatella copri]MCW4169381.1 hypothetical protein [Segatella copri]
MNKEERNTFRKEMLGKLEEQWAKNNRKHPTPILAVWTISATFAPC